MTRDTMIGALARQLAGLSHVAVGAQSPVPATAALLAQCWAERRGERPMRVSILGSDRGNPFTDGGKELFDCAGQGRVDAFFLSGGQIDGAANINLMGGGPTPLLSPAPRFPGTFGSAYLYFVVPRVILFRDEHSTRTLVEKVDFISAPGTSAPGIYRPGGPVALVTGRAVFDFDRNTARFTLTSTHAGETIGSIGVATGFKFTTAREVVTTPRLTADDQQILHASVLPAVAETYPAFAATLGSESRGA